MSNNQRLFTDEQIDQANRMNLIAYAKSRGHDLKRISNNSYKLPGYGGFFISGDGTKWNWFSQNKGGGAIQFIMEMEGKSWVDAVKELLGITNDEFLVVARKKEVTEKGKLILPKKNDTYKHIFAYLIKSRFIDNDVVADFVDKKMLYEDISRNCVFVGFNDKHEPAYASRRSTRTVGEVFKGDVRNSDKSWPFHYSGSSDTVCVFEAPIDLMSYLSLLKLHGIEEFEHHLISLGGVTDKALQRFLKLNKKIDTIMLCLDNDQAGHDACLQINEKYGNDYKLLRHKPKGKDFNEDLVATSSDERIFAAREPPDEYEIS
jgi:hypothetical protein